MEFHVRIVTDAKSKTNALKVLKRTQQCIEMEFGDPVSYHKSGFVAAGVLASTSVDWPSANFEALRHVKSLGYGFHVSGDIEKNMSITIEKPSVIGLVFVEIQLGK